MYTARLFRCLLEVSSFAEGIRNALARTADSAAGNWDLTFRTHVSTSIYARVDLAVARISNEQRNPQATGGESVAATMKELTRPQVAVVSDTIDHRNEPHC